MCTMDSERAGFTHIWRSTKECQLRRILRRSRAAPINSCPDNFSGNEQCNDM